MCEPTHSIVQFPPEDDNGNPTDTRLAMGLGKILDWGKKIKDYFHFSKLGSGHSQALQLSGHGSLIIPDETRYEALWWHRKVKLDGGFKGREGENEWALEAATEYAERVSIGSLSLLRRFLETSLRKTANPGMYIERFRDDFLNTKGKIEFDKKWLNYVGQRGRRFGRELLEAKSSLETAIKVMLGFTRKRNLIVPEWADFEADQVRLGVRAIPLME